MMKLPESLAHPDSLTEEQLANIAGGVRTANEAHSAGGDCQTTAEAAEKPAKTSTVRAVQIMK